jgi:hypothetical protein
VLVIDITDDGGAPTPTGPHGRPVSPSAVHTSAMYYRGWMPSVLYTVLCSGGGAYFFPDQKASCRWNAGTINLLILTTTRETFAIVGARENGIGEHALVSIAQRLPGGRAG